MGYNVNQNYISTPKAIHKESKHIHYPTNIRFYDLLCMPMVQQRNENDLVRVLFRHIKNNITVNQKSFSL